MPNQLVLQAGGTIDVAPYDGPYAKSVLEHDIIVASSFVATPPALECAGNVSELLNVLVSPSENNGRVRAFAATADGGISVAGAALTAYYVQTVHVLRPSVPLLSLGSSVALAQGCPSNTNPTLTSPIPVVAGQWLLFCSHMHQNCGPWGADIALHGSTTGTASVIARATYGPTTGSFYTGAFTSKYALVWKLLEVLSTGTVQFYAFHITAVSMVPAYDETALRVSRRYLLM